MLCYSDQNYLKNYSNLLLVFDFLFNCFDNLNIILIRLTQLSHPGPSPLGICSGEMGILRRLQQRFGYLTSAMHMLEPPLCAIRDFD